MATSPHLLHVNSRPTVVSNALWKEWYIKEHLPDLVEAKSCDRATFYEEIPYGSNQHPDHPKKFLALYQTGFEELLKSDEYKGIRNTSELFEKESSRSNKIGDNGDFDARYYNLLQNYDPNGVGESLIVFIESIQINANLALETSPCILAVYMNPEDPDDFEKWYREEHLEMLSKLPGYKRSLRYKIGPRTPLTQGDTQPYLALHFVDDVSAFGSKESEAASTTPWTVKHIEQSKPFIARGLGVNTGHAITGHC